MTISPGYRRFTAVHNIARGYHLCLFLPNLEGAETDLDEATARKVFECEWQRSTDLEARRLRRRP